MAALAVIGNAAMQTIRGRRNPYAAPEKADRRACWRLTKLAAPITASANKAGTTPATANVPLAARAAAPAQAIDANASANVATCDEVCRRRNWLRLAWERKQSWM